MNLAADFRQILDRKLVGVAFYQSPPIDGRRTLTCHGPATIYGALVKHTPANGVLKRMEQVT
jgi:hypothetical protein